MKLNGIYCSDYKIENDNLIFNVPVIKLEKDFVDASYEAIIITDDNETIVEELIDYVFESAERHGAFDDIYNSFYEVKLRKKT